MSHFFLFLGKCFVNALNTLCLTLQLLYLQNKFLYLILVLLLRILQPTNFTLSTQLILKIMDLRFIFLDYKIILMHQLSYLQLKFLYFLRTLLLLHIFRWNVKIVIIGVFTLFRWKCKFFDLNFWSTGGLLGNSKLLYFV